MRLHLGFEMQYRFPERTPMILTVNVHSSRSRDLLQPDRLTTEPSVAMSTHRDAFGNLCRRLVAPAGRLRIRADTTLLDCGEPDPVHPLATERMLERLPADVLPYLMGSRYCETDLLAPTAWDLFGTGPTGWERVTAICEFVHRHITFDYQRASSTRTALDAYREGAGVCRDYAHLAIAFCRSLNIPARYCTGYLGDIGTPPPYGPGDFAAWFEAWLDGRWHTFDPRNNVPRIGRVLVARGRDACDVPLACIFGPSILEHFEVWTNELPDDPVLDAYARIAPVRAGGCLS
ncbi:MAG: transglutaminase family protein [Pseudomonadales bacterium]|jgi:transglutaminase-like putative cysteine protease|nr:transglutaminase family protein [Pseudomonadales bacterium]